MQNIYYEINNVILKGLLIIGKGEIIDVDSR